MPDNANNFTPLIQDMLYGHAEGLFLDPLGQSLEDIWRYGVADPKIIAMIRQRVAKHRLDRAFGGIPFREPQLEQGDLVIGFDLEGRPLGMPLQYANAHELLVANSGAGKTNYAYFKILQMAPRIPGMWLWDLRKREFHFLRPYLARMGIDLIVVPARQLRLNPLQLPLGVIPADWIPRIADMFVEVLTLPPRASKLLQVKLFRLYQTFGIFEGKTLFPTSFDLFEAVRSDSSANPPARQAILDSLEPVLLSLGPDVLAWRRGWCSRDLAQYPILFELLGVAESDKNLIINSLILSESSSRIARGISNPHINLWMCLDEAARLACSSEHSAVADLITLIRGTGMGLDLSLQGANSIHPQILSNTATKVQGRCGSAGDYQTMGRAMGLTSEQINWAQLNLRPGLFIGQLGEGSWRHPFVFQVPQVHLHHHIPSESPPEQPLKALPAVPAEP